MRYAKLALLAAIAISVVLGVGWGLVEIKRIFVVERRVFSWGGFVVIMSVTLGVTYSVCARVLLREIKGLKNK